MRYQNGRGKVNVKLLIILLVVTAGLGVSLVVARQARRSALSEKALAAGEAAFASQDWPAAVKSYREYLGRRPNDGVILRKYAEACLSVRPLDAAAVSGAISAYRRILQLVPGENTACEKLALLYGGVGNFEELAALARARLEQDPNDRQAPLWLAEAQSRLNKTAEAKQTLQGFIEQLQLLPGKYPEYARACIRMSQLAESETSPQAPGTTGEPNAPQPGPIDWLNRAVDYAPDAAEVLVSRAQFQRRMAEMSGTSEQDKAVFLARARQDLEAADARGTDDPRVCFALGAEWMAHGELDRAAAELQAADTLPPDKLKEHFFDLSDWTVARFLFAAELAARRGTPAEGTSLADETLKALTEKRRRAQVLPVSIPLYVAAGRVTEARRALDEYLGLLRAQEGATESPRKLAGLQALVAGAENRPYTVIEALEPVVRTDASGPVLRLLAEAYDRTGQSGRAARALVQYRRLNPQDVQALRELARQYAKMGDWKSAFDTAGMAESLGSTDPVLKILRIGAAINLAAQQRDPARTEEFERLSAELADLRRAEPEQVNVRILQSVIADSLGRPEDAEKELRQAIAECREPLRAEMQLAGHYARAKRLQEAIGVCVPACRQHGAVAEPWLALSDLYVANADYEAARQSLQQGLSAVAETRDRRSLSMKLAVLEVVHGDRPTGIGLLKELAAADPQETQARSLLLGIREIQQDPATAEALLGALRQAEGESGLWWRVHQASLWLSSRDWASRQQDTASVLRYCIEADPSWSAPVLLLVGMYERLGDFRRVEDVCRQGLLQNPSAGDIADRLLALLERQGRFADAERILQQVRISPRRVSDWQVRMALGAKDFSRAIDELKVRASNDARDAASRIQLARLVYQETKDADQAFGYLQQAQAVDPNSRTLVAVRASILRGEGRSAEALRVLDEYVAKHNEFDAYWMRAVYLMEEGNLERAEEDYRKLTGLAQNAAVGYELLGNFYAGTQRLDAGVAALEKGLQAYPDDLRLQRRLMQMLFRRNQPQDRERALALLTALEERLPQDTELVMMRALQALQEPTPQSLAGAREKLESVVRLQPAAVNAHLTLIGIAMRQEDYQAACAYAVRALESNPGQPVLLVARARAELALGYAPMAARLAREALGQDPNSVEALTVLTEAAVNARDRTLLEEARRLNESALGRTPGNEQLLITRAHVLVALQTPQVAIPALEAYCRSPAGDASVMALVTLADLYRLSGDMKRAGQWLDRAEQLHTNTQAVLYARVLWLIAQQRYDDLAHISAAFLAAPEQDLSLVLKAAEALLSLEPQSLKKEARTLFEHAAALAPTSIDARLGVASALYQTGDAEGAEKLYRQLLEQHPDNVRVLNDLAWVLQEHSQRYDEALELANRGLRLAHDNPYVLHLLDTRGTILANLPDRLADAKSDFEELVRQSSSDPHRQAQARLKLERLSARLEGGTSVQ
jgi:tetratricopeptide (TPR) repeat protein